MAGGRIPSSRLCSEARERGARVRRRARAADARVEARAGPPGTVAAEKESCGMPMHVQITLLSFCSEIGAPESSGVRERMAPLGLGEGHSGSCVSRSQPKPRCRRGMRSVTGNGQGELDVISLSP